MDSTLTAILRRHTQEGAATRVPQVLGLVLLWSREEPQRVGEVALFAPSPDGRAHVLGRAGLLHTVRITRADQALRLRVQVAPGDFIRAELRAGRRLLALTNPVYLR